MLLAAFVDMLNPGLSLAGHAVVAVVVLVPFLRYTADPFAELVEPTIASAIGADREVSA